MYACKNVPIYLARKGKAVDKVIKHFTLNVSPFPRK
jgi:hypothetical protein